MKNRGQAAVNLSMRTPKCACDRGLRGFRGSSRGSISTPAYLLGNIEGVGLFNHIRAIREIRGSMEHVESMFGIGGL